PGDAVPRPAQLRPGRPARRDAPADRPARPAPGGGGPRRPGAGPVRGRPDAGVSLPRVRAPLLPQRRGAGAHGGGVQGRALRGAPEGPDAPAGRAGRVTDAEVFAAAAAAHRGVLLKIAGGIAGHAEADDVVQTALLNAWERHLAKGRPV